MYDMHKQRNYAIVMSKNSACNSILQGMHKGQVTALST